MRRSHRVKLMAHALTWPILAGLAVSGAALGIHLGHSSVSEIDPTLFAEPDTRFHSDLVPSPPSLDGYVARVDGPATAGLGSGCIGCRTYPEEYYPVPDPAIERLSAASAAFEEPPAIPAYQQDSTAQQTARPAGFERIERYSSFRVSSEEAQAAPVQVEAASQASAADSEASAVQGDEVAVAE